ncbi:MAG: Spy/CpxP family protein refolding chaperone [Alphaproteobacteria bacterium]
MIRSRFCPRAARADTRDEDAPRPDRPDRMDHMDGLEEFAADILALAPDQRAAFDGFVAGLRAAEADLRAAAGTPQRDEPAPTRFDRIATTLTAAQEGLARVRPSFEVFYAGLDGLQRSAVDRFAARGGGGGCQAFSAQSPNSEAMGRE